jgi:threonine dehydratase
VVEPSGALAPAAARYRAAEAGLTGVAGTVVAVVSGGNVDPDRYRALLESPLP